MKTIILTETQIKKVLDNFIMEGSHNVKELKRLLSWAKSHADCSVSDTKNGGKICGPKSLTPNCYSYHNSDSAVEPVKAYIARVHGVSKLDVNQAYKDGTSIDKKKD
jgi:hypothetical protein